MLEENVDGSREGVGVGVYAKAKARGGRMVVDGRRASKCVRVSAGKAS